MRGHARLDAIALAVLGALGVMGALIDVPDAVRLLVGVPLVLVAPGYGLQRLLVPTSPRLGWAERLALSVVASLAVVIALGLLLQVTPKGIDARPVGFLLGGVCLILGALLSARTPAHPARLPSRPASAVIPFAMAALLGVAAATYGIVRSFEPAERSEAQAGLDTTLLAGLVTDTGVRLDVQSAERVTTGYILRILVDGVAAPDVPLELAPGERWSRSIEVADGPLDVQLFRSGDTQVPYRRLLLRRRS